MSAVEQSTVDDNEEQPAKERIILNVGGVRYETYRHTLTAYPETRLGMMFRENTNLTVQKSANDEYFIDRDCHLFRYILQFYRTGKVPMPDDGKGLIPISREELEVELDYFLIPRTKPVVTLPPPPELSFRRKLIATDIDRFVASLKSVVVEIAKQFKREFLLQKDFEFVVEVGFREDGRIGDLTINPPVTVKSQIRSMLEPLGTTGFLLLDKFGKEIGGHLDATVSGLQWSSVKKPEPGSLGNWIGMVKYYLVRIAVKDTFCDHEKIVEDSILSVAIDE